MGAVKRIGIILFIIFLMPVLFFSVYEISSLNQDEEAINEIYEKQLEAILFSANQYSDDILNTWVSKIELSFDNASPDSISEIDKLLILNPTIRAIVRYNTRSKKGEEFHTLLEPDASLSERLISQLKYDEMLLFDLIKYQKQGYQKIESRAIGYENLVVLLFHPGNNTPDHIIYAILIEPEQFIDEIIGPRLQYIAQDRFAIIAKKIGDQFPVYSTYDSANNQSISNVLTKDLWLLPDYQLGLSTRGATIDTIVKERTKTDLILIIVLDLVLILGVFLTFRNVRKEVQLAQNKSEFISNVSHELRTPLALINMFAETLEMGRVKSSEKRAEYYSIIHKETQRLTGIVNKILSFSQMEAGKKQLNFSPVNLSDICNNVLDTYDYHFKKEGFKVVRELEPNVQISADADAMTEVIINLIDNAIKYSTDKKELEVSLKTKGGKAKLKVKDYGVGISKNDQRQIFEKFYRSATGDLAKKQGTGLGLALVKQIVDAHKGTIDLESDLGKGSSFNIYFERLKEKDG